MSIQKSSKVSKTAPAGKAKPPKEKEDTQGTPPGDPLEYVSWSRANERNEVTKALVQLDKLRLDTLRALQVSRAKFHTARWKMLNKAMDD